MASLDFYSEGAVGAVGATCAIFWKVTAGQLRDLGHTHTHTHTQTRWTWFLRVTPARQFGSILS